MSKISLARQLVIACSLALTASMSWATSSASIQSPNALNCDLSHSFTLTEAVSQALCANPSVQVIAHQRAAALEASAMAKSAYLPTISASASQSLGGRESRAHQIGVSLNWLLWDFGERAARVAAAQAMERQSLFKVDAHANALIFSVIQAYLSVQSLQSQEKSTAAQVVVAEQALKLAQSRLALGDATPLDESLAQNALAQEQLALTRVNSTKSDAQIQLAKLLSLPAHLAYRIQLSDELTAAHLTAIPNEALENLISEAISRHPDILAAKANRDALAHQVIAAKAAHLPSIALTGQVSSTRTGQRAAVNQNILGLSIQIPLYSGGATSAQTRQIAAQLNASKAQEKSIREELSYQIASSYQSIRLMAAQVSAASQLVESAGRAQTLALEQYRAGVGSMLDVLEALTKSSQAQHALNLAVLDGHQLRAKLAWHLGLTPLN